VPQKATGLFLYRDGNGPDGSGIRIIMAEVECRIRWESAEDVLIAEQAMQSTDLTTWLVVRDGSFGGERQRCMIARALAQAPKSSCWMSPPRFSISSTRLKSARLCAGLKRNVA